MANVQAHAEAVWELVDQDAEVEQVATGFTFTEGPIWHPTENHLLFSDMPGDVRRKYTPDGTVVEVMRPSNKCNGMTYDADLNLIVCEHVTSSLIRENTDGTREVVASHFEGKELNSPNDVVVGSDGSIYFSDPWFGRMPVFGLERERDLGWQGVFRVPPGGGIELVVDRDAYDQPNGLCFSPDESLMYINDTMRGLIDVYDVNPDGSLRPDWPSSTRRSRRRGRSSRASRPRRPTRGPSGRARWRAPGRSTGSCATSSWSITRSTATSAAPTAASR